MIRQIIEISTKPSIELQKLSDTGLLRGIFPELSALDVVLESIDGEVTHKNNFYHTLQVLDHVAAYSSSPILRWAAVLHDIGKPASQALDQETGRWTFWNHANVGAKMVCPILARYGVPQEWWYDIKELVYLHMRPIALVKKDITDSAVRRVMTDSGSLLNELLDLAEADITSQNRQAYLENLKKVRELIADVKTKDIWTMTNPVYDGNWIMEHYDIQDPAQIGVLKDHMKGLILNNGVPNTKKDLLPELRKKAKEIGLCRKKKNTTTELLNTGEMPQNLN
jgi:putative nucleotidyltransferase with HDIG domain